MDLSDAKEKILVTPGIDPGTFQFVAQCLNHYAAPERKSSKRLRIQRCDVSKMCYFIQLVNKISAEVKVSGLRGEGKCVHCVIAPRYVGIYVESIRDAAV